MSVTLLIALALQAMAPTTSKVSPEQSTAVVTWRFDEKGKFHCQVIKSAGEAALDKQACSTLEETDLGKDGTAHFEFFDGPNRNKLFRFRTESVLPPVRTPDELDPAMVPYLVCLIEEAGHTHKFGKFDSPVFPNDKGCVLMRSWARERALAILSEQSGPRQLKSNENLVDDTLAIVEGSVIKAPTGRKRSN